LDDDAFFEIPIAQMTGCGRVGPNFNLSIHRCDPLIEPL
jgi:hypothetical protein